jgi:4-amino-4-deoxy-L-arabinose transferase-like glycosyltransferase
MLFAVSAALFYCLARAFHRGLTTRLAIVTGVVIVVGFLTKLNFVGIAPGAFVALAIIAARRFRLERTKDALRPAALAAAIGGAPVLLFIAINALSGHPTLGVLSSGIGATHGSVLDDLNYIWQSYVPRLPGTVNDFPACPLSARSGSTAMWADSAGSTRSSPTGSTRSH